MPKHSRVEHVPHAAAPSRTAWRALAHWSGYRTKVTDDRMNGSQ
jgi:hypothetical protein